ncbi:thiamine-binding protein [Thermosyntropha sp.]|uniref:thiamine-binding protein n=1 Tax=Thermosyntropha sp. TaxID=2740820 RepID=UPI0025F00A15|nr:thiamine-binding protein [Thermosyntropha sp.]MBO8158677.1 thiamine-binding protein [Thermosyntropha sp.]
MPEAHLSLKILPVVEENKIYEMVDKAIEVLIDSGLNYVVGPSETTVEGDLDTLLDLVKKANQICIENGAPRVVSVITIDYKPGGVTIDEKIGKYRP